MVVTEENLEGIVRRIFSERRTTLLEESAAFQATDLEDKCLELRAQMLLCLEGLPDKAFRAVPDRLPGEDGWTAGEIVSHNSDRLVWALTRIESAIFKCDRSLPLPPEVVVSNASREPEPLDRDLALDVLQAANHHVSTALPLLLAEDRGLTAAGTHHGPMDARSWLLLICIHDSDHLGQLRSRGITGKSGQG